jgi:hypothetical protein
MVSGVEEACGKQADNNFIEAHDVPSSSLSLRSASMITSGSKQGFVRLPL